VSLLEAIAIGLAGMAAGTINTVVGSGTLITFPTLLAFGVPPVTANVSNTIGLVPGSVSGVVGYRRELEGQRSRVLRIGLASLVGGVLGGVLLLVLPDGAFSAIVPVLVGLGIVLVIFQPRISRWVAARHDASGAAPRNPVLGAWWGWPAVLLAGVYGGYFGAAQGVLLMGIMGVGIPETLQRLNALKNVLAAIVNAVAGLLFAVVADVDWTIAVLIGVGATIGGQLGATVGRRLPAPVLRGTIVVVGLVALAVFLLG
jgi:uncharacterized membrane protein YfcA